MGDKEAGVLGWIIIGTFVIVLLVLFVQAEQHGSWVWLIPVALAVGMIGLGIRYAAFKDFLFGALRAIRVAVSPPPQKSARRLGRLSKGERENVWFEYIGRDKIQGPCHACRITIHFSDFEAGHDVAISLGGTNAIGNLRPVCRRCNRAMGTTFEEYKQTIPSTPRRKPSRRRFDRERR